MTTDLDHGQLDDLLRRTLSGRAERVTSGPEWDGSPGRRSRAPWIAAAAAAVAVLGVAGGIAYLAPADDHHTTAGSSISTACPTKLSHAWKKALNSTTFTADGHVVFPDVLTPSGAVLGSWRDGHNALHAVFVTSDGTARALPAGDGATSADTDGRYAVFSSGPTTGGDKADHVNDIAVVNVSTTATTHILAEAPTPRGWVPASYLHSAVIQDGIVYWGMRPAGSDDHVTRTDVVSYTVATGRYAIVDRIRGDFSHRGTNEVDRDVRGVGWTGGSVRSKGTPAGLPGFRTTDGRYQPVSSDGRAAAWSLHGDGSTVYWTDGTGDVKEFHVPQQADPDNAIAVNGVSGPLVFFWFNSNIGGELVLDTRTGAFAPTGLAAGTTVDADKHRVLLSDFGKSTTTVVDTGNLPALHC